MADPKSNLAAAERFAQAVAASLAEGTFVRLAISAPVNAAESAGKILGRCIVLKGVPHLSLTFRHATNDVTKNLPMNAVAAWLHEQLGRHYRSALLGTTTQDWQFISKADGQARLIAHNATTRKAPTRSHDQAKATFLDESAHDWLTGLGVLDRDGKLRASMADKHRQISHYLEILSHLAKECGWNGAPVSDPVRIAVTDSTDGPGRRTALQLVDMGCGKGYLTFGAWHYFRRVCQLPVSVVGVEARAELVSSTNQLAKRINAAGLEFVAGTIASAKLPPVDALIALHACDTATDDAIGRGVGLGAKLIVVAPCCHKELRPQLGKPGPLAAVLRHGLMQERMAEWVTDGLRTLFLEWAGYRTKSIEFVAGEHTPKNLMIAAIREREPFKDQTARKRVEEFKMFFGIQHQALDPLLKAADVRGLGH